MRHCDVVVSSFLCGLFWSVLIEKKSSPQSLLCGVLQGLILFFLFKSTWECWVRWSNYLGWCPISVPGECRGLDRVQWALAQAKQDWMVGWVLGPSRVKSFPPLLLDGVELPQMNQVCNLGILLDSQLCWKSKWQSRLRRPCTPLSCVLIAPILKLISSFHSHSCSCDFPYGLWQCAVHGAYLEGHM